MQIARRLVGGVIVLDLTGPLMVSATEAEIAPLRAAIRGLTAAGHVEVALNLAGVTHLDARGLGEIVCALNVVRAQDGRLILLAPPPRVARLLAVTRLDTVFEICKSEEELMHSFALFASLAPLSSFTSFGERSLCIDSTSAR
jgi:anti-anti-sigma factor